MRNLSSFSGVQGSLEVIKVHEGGQVEGQSLDKEKGVTYLGPCMLSVPSAGSTRLPVLVASASFRLVAIRVHVKPRPLSSLLKQPCCLCVMVGVVEVSSVAGQAPCCAEATVTSAGVPAPGLTELKL